MPTDNSKILDDGEILKGDKRDPRVSMMHAIETSTIEIAEASINHKFGGIHLIFEQKVILFLGKKFIFDFLCLYMILWG